MKSESQLQKYIAAFIVFSGMNFSIQSKADSFTWSCDVFSKDRKSIYVSTTYQAENPGTYAKKVEMDEKFGEYVAKKFNIEVDPFARCRRRETNTEAEEVRNQYIREYKEAGLKVTSVNWSY